MFPTKHEEILCLRILRQERNVRVKADALCGTTEPQQVKVFSSRSHAFLKSVSNWFPKDKECPWPAKNTESKYTDNCRVWNCSQSKMSSKGKSSWYYPQNWKKRQVVESRTTVHWKHPKMLQIFPMLHNVEKKIIKKKAYKKYTCFHSNIEKDGRTGRKERERSMPRFQQPPRYGALI